MTMSAARSGWESLGHSRYGVRICLKVWQHPCNEVMVTEEEECDMARKMS